MAIRTFGRRRVPRVRRGGVTIVAAAGLLHQFPFGLLLSAPLLLPQELLGLQEDPGVDAHSSGVAVPGALVAGVPGVVLGRLEALSWWVGFVPGILGNGAGIFPGLPEQRGEDRA